MRSLAIVWAIFVSMVAVGQELISPVRSDLIPPSPKSASIVEAQIPAPSLLTGASSFSLPIHTIEVDGYTLPITLQYQSNGVKVFDQSAPYGLGWNMTPALRATRTIMGRPDEEYEFKEFGAIIGGNEPWYTAFQCMANSRALALDTDVLYDSQHDIFTFAIQGKTITRVLDASTEPYRFFGVDDVEYLVESDKELTEITITGPDGTVYLFGAPNEFQTIDEAASAFRTGWALNKIRLSSGRDITLNWSNNLGHGPRMTYIGGASYIDNRNLYDFYGYPDNSDFENSSMASGVLSYSLPDDKMLILESIVYPGGKIDFDYRGEAGSFLSEIGISNDDKSLHTIRLSYRSTGYAHWVLSEIDTGEGSPYEFEYYTYGRGVWNPHSQDWWGYYNAIENGTLEPRLRMHEQSPHKEDSVRCYSMHIGEADRSINEDAMKADILKSIRYPTGAVAEFDYETHYFEKRRQENDKNISPEYDVYLDHGGGLRVKTVTMRNGDADASPQIIRYEYPLARVRAVPSASTFVNVSAAAMPKGLWGSLSSSTYCPVRLVNVMPISDYMRYDMGETPIWYDHVTEIHAEGKVEYYFKDMISRPNSFYDRFGIRMINSLSKVFSSGPQLVEKNIYKGSAGNYEKIESERSFYRVYYYGAIISTHINREMIMMGTNSGVQPDFDEGHIMRGAGPYGTSPDISIDHNVDDQFPYSAIAYGVERQTELMVANETVRYHGGDSMVIRKEFSYLPLSAIVSDISEKCGSENRETSYTFASKTAGGISAEMAEKHVVNVPLRAQSTRNGTTMHSEADYESLGGRLFRPRRIKTWFDGASDTIVSPTYAYHGHRLCGFTDADGVSSAYIWGYKGNLPVYRIDGIDFKTATNVHGSLATSGYAESYDFQSSARRLYTKAMYTQGLGVTSVRQPCGTVERYEYDNIGRLVKTSVDGLGTVAAYEYRINHDGNNSISSRRWLDSEGVSMHVTAVYYDYRGRPIESKDFSGGSNRNIIDLDGRQGCTALSVFSEYDDMGRLSRTSVPSASKPSDAASWTDMVYESSPRATKIAETKPGEEWKTGGKSATARVAVNTAVLPWSCPRFVLADDGAVEYKGLWPVGNLTVTENIDEDGHAVYEATDFEGRKLMRREGSGNDWLSTYYIYDGFGRLRRILQPILEAKSYDSDDIALEDFGFEYRYDGAGRCVYERIPGSVPTLRRYSAAGRVVAEHLPAMEEGEWRVFFYDVVGRKVLEGVASFTDAALEEFVARSPLVYYSQLHSPTLRFSHPDGFPAGFQAVAANYYDDYSFLTGSGLGLGFNVADGYSATRSTHVWGLPTGTADLGDDGEFRYEVYYYDALGRMIQRRSHTPEGKVTRSMRLDYTGAVEAERTTVSRPDTTLTFETVTEYDKGERPYQVSYRLESDSVRVKYTYNNAGLLSRVGFGLNLARRYEYDVHGWPVKTETLLPNGSILWPGKLQRSQGYYSDIAVKDTLPRIVIKPDFEILSVRYTETIHYADGAVPRYSGEMSGRTTTFGGRYDYRYDAHDRLVGADYTAAPTDTVCEDFSVAYTYDAIGRPLTLRRYGVIGIDGTVEGFDLLDDLIYTYDGARPATIARKDGVNVMFAQTGAESTAMEFNAAGLLERDSGRSVVNISYNRLGLPVSTIVQAHSVHASKATSGIKNIYSSSGKLLSVVNQRMHMGKAYMVGSRKHIANFTFGSGSDGVDTLSRVDFPGGYFDGRGVHWMLPDAIGSVELVVDGEGEVEQHTGYYPYGEPWREPSGQPYLFGSKERRRFASLHDSDFHARFLTTATALWQAPDPHAGKYPWLSPWVFCAANPVRFRDPSGKDIYEFNRHGDIIERIKIDDYDMLRIKTEDLTYIETSKMPAGTIQEQWQDDTETNNDYFQIIGDDNSSYLFEFLEEHTDVEYTHVQSGEEGDNAVNYISTSHLAHGDYSGGNIMEGLLKKDIDFGNGIVIKKTGDVRSHTHNHPTNPYPSREDHNFTQHYREYPNIRYSIYNKSVGYRTYHSSRGREIIRLK